MLITKINSYTFNNKISGGHILDVYYDKIRLSKVVSIKMMFYLNFSFLFFFFLNSVFSQGTNKHTNIWYFGRNAGIDFNQNPPAPIFDGQINTWEGCATYCDDNGRILIYTDGQRIWNRNHQIIPGATNLGGDNSATQSGVIVSMPNNPSKLIVFSVDDECESGGLQYAVIDLTMNFGLGGLESKNNRLLDNATEKITVIKHCNEKDFWVIGHGCGNSDFYIWLLDNNGIKSPPKIQTIGSKQNSGWDAIGYMKASSDGKWLAVASGYTEDKVELFQFDSNNGLLSEKVVFQFQDLNRPYGIEFSQSGKYLYFGGAQNQPNAFIFQADISLQNPADILSSIVIVGKASNSSFGALQRAPNGKIYVAKEKSKYLSVIQNPNEPGINCKFIEDELYLGGRTCEFGLPNFIPSNLKEPTFLKITMDSLPCISEKTLNVKTNLIDNSKFLWYKEKDLLAELSNKLVVKESGTYYCKLIQKKACDNSEIMLIDSIKVAIKSYQTKMDIDICQGEMYMSFDKTGIYYDTIPSSDGCDSIIILNLKVRENSLVNIEKNLCFGESYGQYNMSGIYIDTFQSIYGCDSLIKLTLTIEKEHKTQSEKSICSGEKYNGYSSSGIYIKTLKSMTGCDSVHTLHLTVSPSYFFNNTITLCSGESYQFIDTVVNKPGLYSKIYKTSEGCDSIYNLNIDIIENNFLGNDIVNCNINKVILTSNPDTKWFDGSISNEKVIEKSGTYWATLTSNDGCEMSDTISVKIKPNLFIPNVILPFNNSLSENCCFKPIISESNIVAYECKIIDRWGNVVYNDTDIEKAWNGTFDGKQCETGVYIFFIKVDDDFCQSSYVGDLLLLK